MIIPEQADKIREVIRLRLIADFGRAPADVTRRLTEELLPFLTAAPLLMGVQRREDVARIIDLEAWRAIEDGRDALPESLWSVRRQIALGKADAVLALPHTGQPQEGRAAIIEECAKELDEWAETVERVGIHKEQIIAYRNGAAAIRALSAAPASPRAEGWHEMLAALKRVRGRLSPTLDAGVIADLEDAIARAEASATPKDRVLMPGMDSYLEDNGQ